MIHIVLRYESHTYFEAKLPSEAVAFWYMLFPGSLESFPFDGKKASEAEPIIENTLLELVNNAQAFRRYFDRRQKDLYSKVCDVFGQMHFRGGEYPEGTWEIHK